MKAMIACVVTLCHEGIDYRATHGIIMSINSSQINSIWDKQKIGDMSLKFPSTAPNPVRLQVIRSERVNGDKYVYVIVLPPDDLCIR